MYRGCPCPDPPVCHRVQDDSVAKRQPCAYCWCVSCQIVSACERVCELVLCDGVPHCQMVILQTNCDSCVLWHVGTLTPLLDDKRCLASSLSFSNCPTPLFNVTPDVSRRISSSLWYSRNLFNCLSDASCSFGMLSAAVVPKTDCSSTHVLCLCGGLGSSLLSNLLRGLSPLRLLCLSTQRLPSLQSPCLLQRPGTVELFAAPPVVAVLLLLKRFLDGLHLVFQLGSFLFLCGFSSASSVSE